MQVRNGLGARVFDVMIEDIGDSFEREVFGFREEEEDEQGDDEQGSEVDGVVSAVSRKSMSRPWALTSKSTVRAPRD